CAREENRGPWFAYW
nr:immunoglobulin heavy chain junction region [Mus musculus]